MNNIYQLKQSLLSMIPENTLAAEDKYRKLLPMFIDMMCDHDISELSEINDFILTAGKKAAEEIKTCTIPDLNIIENNSTLWHIFHPEALDIEGREAAAEKDLRNKRKIRITKLPDNPVTDPGKEILFTSNILLTLPTEKMLLEKPGLSPRILEQLREISAVPQKYWYDHPIPIGIRMENNEVLYGLENFNRAVAFEKARGSCDAEIKVPVLLSVSVTHPGLDRIARDYLEAELEKAETLDHLDIYVFGENDARDLMEILLIPGAIAAGLHRGSAGELRDLLDVFGTDGEYGRHYSFLKAIAALWRCVVNPKVRGVFKIDLDQVFDQDVLAAETGMSAFELLASPLWGAEGTDRAGKKVFLGMTAGALVNEKDIGKGLFTPDVDYPEKPESDTGEGSFLTLKKDEKIFYSRLPQALSTRAEMMCRYGGPGEPDGISECIQRIHVTGGTNGILIDALHRWRPFTPSFIGRAEDQAYILSGFLNKDVQLAYLHQPGLIMRHDKEAFAAEAIKTAAMGKQIGDYVRILLFSRYAESLPGGKKEIKEKIDPFTGSFVSHLPVSTAVLRLLFKAEEMFESGKDDEAREFIKLGAKRLKEIILFTDTQLVKQLEKERAGWNLYYDILENLSAETHSPSLFRDSAEKIKSCRVQA